MRLIDADDTAKLIKKWLRDYREVRAGTKIFMCELFLSALGNEQQTPTVRAVPKEKTGQTTNAERIRAMDDEELASYIFDLGNGTEYCHGHCAYQNNDEVCRANKDARGYRGCLEGVLEWLRQPSAEAE